MSAALELQGLTRQHGSALAPALDRFDLSVPAGSCVAVLGPSGSGKSTALRLAAGLDRPDAGDVLLDGTSVLEVPAERRAMALVSQRPLLFPHLSVLDNLAFPARVAGRSRREARGSAERYLGLVQLEGLGGRRTHELSGGQAQRVALARALAAEPRVLLLDEPFSALDNALREDMHDLLRRVRSELGPTVVLVTHDPVEATVLADRVALLDEGRLMQHGTVSELYTRPASVRVSRLLGGRNEVPGTVRDGVHRSVLGAFATTAPDGAGLLLVRQESVELGHDGGVVATVVDARRLGARQLLRLALSDGTPLHVEVGPGSSGEPGTQVQVRVPPDAVTVVAPGP